MTDDNGKPRDMSYNPRIFAHGTQHHNFFAKKERKGSDGLSEEEKLRRLEAVTKRFGVIAGVVMGNDLAESNDIAAMVSHIQANRGEKLDAMMPDFLREYFADNGCDLALKKLSEQGLMQALPLFLSASPTSLGSVLGQLMLQAMSSGISTALCLVLDYAIRNPETFTETLERCRMALDA